MKNMKGMKFFLFFLHVLHGLHGVFNLPCYVVIRTWPDTAAEMSAARRS